MEEVGTLPEESAPLPPGLRRVRLFLGSWAAAVTTLSAVLGTLGAWLLHRYRFFGRGVLLGLVMVPVAIPEVIMGISLRIFLIVGTRRITPG